MEKNVYNLTAYLINGCNLKKKYLNLKKKIKIKCKKIQKGKSYNEFFITY